MKLALALALLAGWQGAQTVEPFRLDVPQLAAGADGAVFLSGTQVLDSEDHFLPQPALTVRAAPPGAPFGAPQALGTGVAVGVDATGAATVLTLRDGRLAVGDALISRGKARRPALAVAPSGAAVVTWLEGRRVLAAVREPGTAPGVVASGAAAGARVAPALGSRGFGAPRTVASGASAISSQGFGAPETVASGVAADTQVTPTIGSRGDVVVAWTRELADQPAWAALRRPGGSFSAPLRMETHAVEFELAVGDDGTALVAVTRLRGQRADVRAFTAAASKRRFGTPQTLSCGGVDAVDVAPSGRRIVVCGNRLEVWEGARLKRTARLNTRERSDAVRVDLASDGRALVAWSVETRHAISEARAVAALREPGQPFSAPAFITPQFPSADPQAATLTADGGAVVLTETFGASRSMLLSRYAAAPE